MWWALAWLRAMCACLFFIVAAKANGTCSIHFEFLMVLVSIHEENMHLYVNIIEGGLTMHYDFDILLIEAI